MTDMSSSIRMSTSTRVYLYVSLSLIAAIVLVPLLTTALGGFKTLGDLRTNPFGVPTEWQWANYTDILFGERYWLQIGNSLVIAALTVLLTLIVSSMSRIRPKLSTLSRCRSMSESVQLLGFPGGSALICFTPSCAKMR